MTSILEGPGTDRAGGAGQVDAATLRQLGKRLFEVVRPQAADAAADGKKLAEEEAPGHAAART